MASLISCSRNRLSRSYELQLAYEESIRDVEVVIGEEESRRLRLRILFLEESNDELYLQLAIADDRISHLEQKCTDHLKQIDSEANSHRKVSQSNMKVRQLNNIKVNAHERNRNAGAFSQHTELVSMSAVSTDSTKLLTDKLSLAGELATLKPELEHLRSQSMYQETIYAEKQAIERRVRALEIELQAEKRSSAHAALRSKINENVEVLYSQIHELQAEVSKERLERENVQRTRQRETSELESQIVVLKKMVEHLKAKLRESKSRVKLWQDDSVQARGVRRKLPGLSPRITQTRQNSWRRTAAEMSKDMAIGTPNGVSTRGRQPMEKKGKGDQSLLGEKSMFSITPYLSRTICVSQGSHPISSEPEMPSEQFLPGELPTLRKDKTSPVVGENITASGEKLCKQNVLTNSKSMIMNRKALFKSECDVGTLGKLSQELEAKADQTRIINPAKRILCSIDISASVAKENEPPKKRRKLLGATKALIDDEGGSASRRPARAILGPARSLAKGGLSGGITLGADMQSSSAAFRAFSPLKKDKKNLQASFLA